MKHFLLLVFLLVLLTGFTHATGIIKGTVIDKKSGEPMIGATVHIKNKNTDFTLATSTGLDGSYTFKNIPAGKYEVEAKYISYKDEEEDTEVTDGIVIAIKLSLETKGHELNEVVIGGHASGETDQAARRVEQRSDQVLNAVSAKTIEVSPDITVANVMQRVSGVSIERSSNGEAQYPIIRGMEKRYISTLVNGIKIPSPDNKNRYIPLDIFPTDIIERLEVYKSLTPSMEGDAIAGSVNLIFKDAPYNFTVNANFSMGYAQNISNRGFTQFDHSESSIRSPRVINGNSYIASAADFPSNPQHFTNLKAPVSTVFGLSMGGRSADKKFGAIGAVSYQDNFRNTNSVYFDTQVDKSNNAPAVQGISRRQYSVEQQRTAVIGKLDYQFNSDNKVNLNLSYINLTQNQYRFNSDTSDLSRSSTMTGNGSVSQDPRTVRTIQQIYNVNLQGDHKLAHNFRINWSAVYSKATANQDQSDLSLQTGKPLVGGVPTQLPLTFDALTAQERIFAHNSDQDKSGYLNLIYTPEIFDTKVEFSVGGMYRNKTRNSTYDDYTLPLASASNLSYDGNIDHNVFAVQNIQGTPNDALNYNFTENVGAAYGQFKFTIGKLQTLGGVRYENTDQSWVSALSASVASGKTGSISYYDLLPSLAFKYMLNDMQNLRLSYYSAVSRPGFYELIPHTGGDPDADYQEIGNPSLKRVTADNYDLRYELFPKGLDQFLAGVFYKRIVNPIEYAIVKPVSESSGKYFLQAENFGTGHNYGFELDFTKYINKFGFRANYTYTDSKITTTKLEDYRDASGNLTNRTVYQSRPLQGQSKHIGNLSLLYKDTRSGLDAQLSAVYTGERINTVSAYLDNDIWQKGAVNLDFSIEKKVYKSLYVSAKVTNLLNTPYQLEVKNPYPTTGKPYPYQTIGKNTFVRKDDYGQFYLIGLRYKL